MKKNISVTAFLVIILFLYFNTKATAQNTNHYLQGKKNNFNTFTTIRKTPGKKWLASNAGYANHADAIFLSKDDPKPGAIEIFSKRTRDSRYFIDGDTSSKFYIVKSIGDINYQKNGQWFSIDKRLMPKSGKIFEASRQQEPVGFDIEKQTAYIKACAGTLYFNNWQLVGKNKNGDTLLAKPDWANVSEGDDGIKITNIFPGIDAEMIVDKGSIKTNFIVKENQFPGYQQLIFCDEFKTGTNSKLTFQDGQQDGERQSVVDFSIKNKTIAQIDKAVMYSENNQSGFQFLNYKINQNKLSLIIDANDLNKRLANGQIVIDPLVSVIDSLPAASITGSMSNCTNTIQTCNYSLQMQTPAKATITSTSFQFGYTAFAPSAENQGDFSIALGTCNSGNFTVDPNGAGDPTKPGSVSTLGMWADISSTMLNCVPAASCAPQQLTFTLLFYNTTCGNAIGCSNEYVAAEEAFQVLIEGHTLEIDSLNNKDFISATPATICQGANSTLISLGTFGVPPDTYNWNNGGGTNNQVSVSPLETTVYTFTVMDLCGSTASDSVQVTVIPSPGQPSASSNSPICQGGTINLTTPAIAGGTYNWTGPNSFNSNIQNPSVSNATAAASGAYSITVTQNGCTSKPGSATVVVETPAAPSVTINTSTQTICPGAPVTFTATSVNGGTAPTYQWQLNGQDVGVGSSASPVYIANDLSDGDKISCILTSNSACVTSIAATSNIIQIAVSKNIPPTITITASADSICSGAPATFTAIAVNSIASSYQWQLNGNNVGTDNSVYTVNSLNDGDVISCVVTSNSPCFGISSAASNTIKMTVIQNITPTISITASNNNFCSGTSVTFNAVAANAGTSSSYQWQSNGINVGNNNPVYTTTTSANGDKVNCTLTVSNTGCFSSPDVVSNTITMIVNPNPVITLTAVDTVIMINDKTTINASVAGNYSSFTWSPTVGLNDTSVLNPVADPLVTTNYQLAVTSTDGCTVTKGLTIQVFTNIYIPSAFTPNGDGVDDIFRIPPGVVFNLTAFSIYDRWGNKIFETTDISKGWDGTHNGIPSSSGTYVYFITGSDVKGKISLKGTVLLIR